MKKQNIKMTLKLSGLVCLIALAGCGQSDKREEHKAVEAESPKVVLQAALDGDELKTFQMDFKTYRKELENAGIDYANFPDVEEYEQEIKNKGCKASVGEITNNFAKVNIDCGKLGVGGDTYMQNIDGQWKLPLSIQ